MSGSASTEIKAEPNLTPILDMVFQLITFFMLVTAFKAAELDQTLNLPIAGSARPVPSQEGDVLVVNIAANGMVRRNKSDRPDVENYIKKEAVASRLAAKSRIPGFKDDDDLPTIVVLRADKGTPFGAVYRVIAACQNNGYRQFALRSAGSRVPKTGAS